MENSELVELLKHKNEWYSQHARRILQERHQLGNSMGSDTMELHNLLNSSNGIPTKLKAIWALHVINDLTAEDLEKLLTHENEHIRAWAVTLLCENKSPSESTLKKLEDLARKSDSKLVRLHLASALQRIPYSKRWNLVESLISRTEDENDQNLPLMYWYGIEPLIHKNRVQFLSLAAKTKIPLLRQFITRRATEK